MGPGELGPCTWGGLMGLDQSCHWVPESSGSPGYRNTEVFWKLIGFRGFRGIGALVEVILSRMSAGLRDQANPLSDQ